MSQEHDASTGEQLDPVSASLIRGDFDEARGYCGKMSGYPKQLWDTLVGTFERIHTTIHRDRDPKRANELLKESRRDLPASLTKKLQQEIDAAIRETSQTVELLMKTGHPKRAERVIEHLPKKVRKDMRRTAEEQRKGTDEPAKGEPAVPSAASLTPPEHHLLLEESPHAKEILDAIDGGLRQKHWNPKKPTGLSPSERTVLRVIIRAQEEGQPSPSLAAIAHVTGYREGRVKKALRDLRQYRLDRTGWQLQETNDEIVFSQISNGRVNAL